MSKFNQNSSLEKLEAKYRAKMEKYQLLEKKISAMNAQVVEFQNIAHSLWDSEPSSTPPPSSNVSLTVLIKSNLANGLQALPLTVLADAPLDSSATSTVSLSKSVNAEYRRIIDLLYRAIPKDWIRKHRSDNPDLSYALRHGTVVQFNDMLADGTHEFPEQEAKEWFQRALELTL